MLRVNLYDIYTVALFFSLSISPVYWFFGISPPVFMAFKLLLILICFMCSFIYGKEIKAIGIIDYILLVFMIINVLLVSFYYQETENLLFSSIYPLVAISILMFTFSVYISTINNSDKILKLLLRINFFAVTLCLIIIVSEQLNFELKSAVEFGGLDLSFSGFGSLRTGWSGGLAMIVGSNIFFLLNGTIKNNYWLISSNVILIYTQYLSGGRGGLLTSLMLVLYYLICNKKYIYIFVSLSIVSVFLVNNMDLMLNHLRLDRSENEYGGITAGRLDQYLYGIKLIIDNNLFPLGYSQYIEKFNAIGIYNEIHNVWLNFTIQYGFIFLTALIFFIWRGIFIRNNFPTSSKVVLLVMLVPTFVEPAAIFINFGNYLLWWFAFCFNKYYEK